MARIDTLGNFLTDVADAIRTKKGTIDTIAASDFDIEITNLPSGDAGDIELETSFLSTIDNSVDTLITKFPDNLTSVRDYAFSYCKNMSLTELPNTITNIGSSAFIGCTNLALTKLPNNLQKTGAYCFADCTNLALTELPDSLPNIADYAFRNCVNITIKEIPETCGAPAQTGVFYGCKGLTRLAIKHPTLLQGIHRNCFANCSNLVALILPNVTRVISLHNTNAFTETPIADGTGYVYVPDDLVESYKMATNWSTYANQIKPISELPVE